MPSVTSTDQATFQQLLMNDPQIQAIIRSVWGDTPVNQRPSDTPKNLEKANDTASKQIGQILASRGIKLPNHTFINPRTASLEGMHGWAGLPTAAKIAIIGGLAATGVGAAGAMGAFGSAAGAGSAAGGAGAVGTSAIPTIGVTTGIPAGIGTAVGGVGLGTGVGAGTLASTSLAGSAALPFAGGAGNMAGSTIGGLMGAGGSAAAPAAAKTGGLISSLLKPKTLETIGTGIGAISKSQASNRGTALDAMMEGDKMKLAANQDRRAEVSDIWRKMQAANYIKGGGASQAPQMSTSGVALPKFSFAPQASSQADVDMANKMLPELQNRLDNPMQLSNYNSKMNPSTSENILNWLGPIVSAYGAMKTQTPPIQTPTIPPLGAPTGSR